MFSKQKIELRRLCVEYQIPKYIQNHVVDGHIRVWTFQKQQAWHVLQSKKRLYTDGRKAFRIYKYAYDWMREQMHKRIVGYGGKSPLWVWFGPKPDLRRHAMWVKDTVLLECSLPISRVLFSCFSTWHMVLNQTFLSWTKAEDDMRDVLVGMKSLCEQTPEKRQQCLESWERIFDLDHPRDVDWLGKVEEVQGVVEWIDLSEVVSFREFRCNPRKNKCRKV